MAPIRSISIDTIVPTQKLQLVHCKALQFVQNEALNRYFDHATIPILRISIEGFVKLIPSSYYLECTHKELEFRVLNQLHFYESLRNIPESFSHESFKAVSNQRRGP